MLGWIPIDPLTDSPTNRFTDSPFTGAALLHTSDSLFGGKLIVSQEERGYRFSLDAVLLAGLTRIRASDRVMDLGTGCGVIPLVLAHRRATREKIFGIEIQPRLAALARGNVETNGFSGQIEVIGMDMRQAASRFDPESFTLVVSNPPYRRPGTGKVNPGSQKAIARHEIAAALPDVFATAAYLLPRGGRLALIYPAARAARLLQVAEATGFSAKRLTVIYSRPGETARLAHIECNKGGGEELRIEPPFFIYSESGEYSPAMQKLYEE
jgi:tRNA1Val (adenine37-N6)-methyltransferase